MGSARESTSRTLLVTRLNTILPAWEELARHVALQPGDLIPLDELLQFLERLEVRCRHCGLAGLGEVCADLRGLAQQSLDSGRPSRKDLQLLPVGFGLLCRWIEALVADEVAPADAWWNWNQRVRQTLPVWAIPPPPSEHRWQEDLPSAPRSLTFRPGSNASGAVAAPVPIDRFLEKALPLLQTLEEAVLGAGNPEGRTRVARTLGELKRVAGGAAQNQISRLCHEGETFLRTLPQKGADLAVRLEHGLAAIVDRIWTQVLLLEAFGARLSELRSPGIDDVVDVLRNLREAVGAAPKPALAGSRLKRGRQRHQDLSLALQSFVQVESALRRENLEGAGRGIELLERSLRRLAHTPLGDICWDLPATVRELAKHMGKAAILLVDTPESRIPEPLAGELDELLALLVANALEHGIEPPQKRVAASKPDVGRIRIAAEVEGPTLHIRVVDDGAGLDESAARAALGEWDDGSNGEGEGALAAAEPFPLDVLFEKGFTTAKTPGTGKGSGFGMAAVAEATRRLGGSVRAESQPGEGLLVVLSFPLPTRVADMIVSDLSDHAHAPLVSTHPPSSPVPEAPEASGASPAAPESTDAVSAEEETTPAFPPSSASPAPVEPAPSGR